MFSSLIIAEQHFLCPVLQKHVGGVVSCDDSLFPFWQMFALFCLLWGLGEDEFLTESLSSVLAVSPSGPLTLTPEG